MVSDPTLRRVTAFAKEHGFGGVILCNAFAIVSTLPEKLFADPRYAVGPANDDHLRKLTSTVKKVVVAWGSHLERPIFAFRRSELEAIVGTNAFALGLNNGKSPKHPLYLPSTAPLSPFIWEQFVSSESPFARTQVGPDISIRTLVGAVMALNPVPELMKQYASFVMDACDREVIACEASTKGFSSEMIRDILLLALERRFGAYRASHRVECLSNNGVAPLALETIDRSSLKQMTRFTPVRNPESNATRYRMVFCWVSPGYNVT